MTRIAQSLLILVAAGGLALTAAGPAMASGGGSGGSAGSGGVDPTMTTTPSCAEITLRAPEVVSTAIRWTGSATNCSSGTDRILLRGTDVTVYSTPGCGLPPVAYGLPSQAASQIVYWFMTSKNQTCPGSHTERFDAYTDSASVPAASETITYITT